MLETLSARVMCSVNYLWVVGARLRVTLRKVRVWLVEQKEPLLSALSSCMTFLDLTEGDKLVLLVVELHVGPTRKCDALGN
jgi:hypothetical protein